MDKANTVKEKAKLTLEKDEQLLTPREKLKTIAAKAIEAFQQTEEYNTMLFSQYFKGFELLRRYLVKHPSRVDLENLDITVVGQEIVMDEASQSTASTEATPGDTPMPPPDGDDVAIA